ncbi:cytochrome P450 [Allostreptomyces psammosilenae]|uniref:Cytochrome P450 n=1 Tax=Allostreptomyces psammosilenae TaxID=1892865 RepID=A0A853A337_9ACTN|nr:cytochrome P450 [Allostreptomyces psammosilenae]NYI07284.1 cytochrome P450 [Allostreptomyces psammosilenae]
MNPDPHGRGAVSVGTSLDALAVEPLMTAEYDARPHDVYARLRAQHGPVAPVDVLGVPIWLVLGYHEALEVFRDDALWRKELFHWRGRTEGRIPPDWPLLPAMEINHTVMADGLRHQTLRDAWEAALRPVQQPGQRQARQLVAHVRRYADQLIDLFAEGSGGRGTVDITAQYARPLALMLVNRALGFPTSQGDGVIMDLWEVLDAGSDAAEALDRVMASFTELVTLKRISPGEDFPSAMMAAAPDLTVDELARELKLLGVVIADHTSGLIVNTIAEVVGGNAEARASVSQHMIGETVNRVALAIPPMSNTSFRFPVTDVRLGGHTIAAGDPVMISMAAAHADPLFTGGLDSGALTSSRAHLAWGAGPHHCVGRVMATAIVETAVRRLFERCATLEPTMSADELPWRSSPFMRGLRSLPVRFELAETRPAADDPDPEPHATSPGAVEAATEPGGGFASLWRFLRGLRRGR